MLEAILVPVPLLYPNRCVDGSQDGPVIDTHYEYSDQRIYISPRQAMEYGRLVGMVEAAAHDRVAAELESERARRVAAETEVAEARPVLEAMARASARFDDDTDDETKRRRR